MATEQRPERGPLAPAPLTTVTRQPPFSRALVLKLPLQEHCSPVTLQLQLPPNLLPPGRDIPILRQRAGRVKGNKHRRYYAVGELPDRIHPEQLQSPSHPRSQLPCTQ